MIGSASGAPGRRTPVRLLYLLPGLSGKLASESTQECGAVSGLVRLTTAYLEMIHPLSSGIGRGMSRMFKACYK